MQKHCRYGLFTWNKHLFCQRETDSFSLKVTLLKFWNMQISIHAREKLIYIRPLVKNMNSTNNILECHRKKIKVMQSEGNRSSLARWICIFEKPVLHNLQWVRQSEIINIPMFTSKAFRLSAHALIWADPHIKCTWKSRPSTKSFFEKSKYQSILLW